MFANTALLAFTAAVTTALAAATAPTVTRAKAPTAATAAPKTAPKTAPKAQPGAGDIATGIQKFYDKTGGFSAKFVQVVKKRGLRKGLRRSGHVYLKKGRVIPAKDGAAEKQENGKMRWDYPNEEIFYFSDGEVLWTYERRERLAVRLPVKNSRLYQATSYLVGQGNLARDFKLSVVPSTVRGTWALKLIPKAGTQTMRSLTLVVDKKTYAVRGSVLIDPLGDSTTLLFSGAKYDAVKDKTFEWTPPAGVRVKKM